MADINRISRIIQALTEEGWRQVDIAEYLDLSQAAVSQLKSASLQVIAEDRQHEILTQLERLIAE